jgi:hypothetical protein
MQNITRISTSISYLGLSNGFNPNNLIFNRNIETNISQLGDSELPSFSVKQNLTYIAIIGSNMESILVRILGY